MNPTQPATLVPEPALQPQLSLFGRWWLASRPKTLPAAATPVLVGCACAHAAGGFALGPAAAALAGALLLQIAANFANDVFDFEKGADTAERLGPVRAVQAGWISARSMRRALWLVLALALVVGLYLVSVAGPLLIAIGIASIAGAVAYTAGPYPLGYHGLGDVAVFLFFGVVAVAGTAFVQLGYVTELAWASSVPVGCLTTAILVVNNVRDAATDVLANKRTLPVRFGIGFGIAEYHVLLGLAYALPLWLLWRGQLTLWALLPWLSLPLAVDLSRRIRREAGPALNGVLAHTARLLLCFGVLLSASLLLGAPSSPRGAAHGSLQLRPASGSHGVG
ncbi:MAG TPA: 1,4-dihydroxy-2-naphthoate polyprenyltransferase [Polyangiaceae bacterium]|nr:1,4-dihydroxy-2-naphthoate polyprenyltransferase [Polyangiaceae bacterium]